MYKGSCRYQCGRSASWQSGTKNWDQAARAAIQEGWFLGGCNFYIACPFCSWIDESGWPTGGKGAGRDLCAVVGLWFQQNQPEDLIGIVTPAKARMFDFKELWNFELIAGERNVFTLYKKLPANVRAVFDGERANR